MNMPESLESLEKKEKREGRRAWSNLIIAVVMLLAFWLVFDAYLTGQVQKYYHKGVDLEYGIQERDKGLILASQSEISGNVFLLGSSELSNEYPQLPGSFFPREGVSGVPGISFVGSAYTQSLLHMINLSVYREEQELKLVFIVSPQWFWGSDIDSDGLSAKFSELRYYNFLLSDLPDESKGYASRRLLKHLRGAPINTYAYLLVYSQQGVGYKPLQIVAHLPMLAEIQFLKIKDKYQAYVLLASKSYSDVPERPLNWEEEKRLALEMGEASVTNNDYNIDDAYYNTYIRDAWDKNADAMRETPTQISPEYDDYEMFLKMCTLKGIKPLIVLPPANGYWYDHCGLTREKRQRVNARIQSMAERYGFEVLSFGDCDYEPYYLSDIMHMGWMGWYYVDEKIANYFN